MDDFETAVLLALDPQSNAAMRSKAIEFTESVRLSPDGWRFCAAKINEPYRAEVVFWCLGVLVEWLLPGAARSVGASSTAAQPSAEGYASARYTRLTPEDRAAFRHQVSQCLVRMCAAQPHGAASASTSTGSERLSRPAPPAYVRNKLAQLVAFLIGSDFPHEWPSAFADVLQFLEYSFCEEELRVDMYFRIVRAVDDEITSIRAGHVDKQRSMRVKDTLRESNIAQVAASWAAFLSPDGFAGRAREQGGLKAAVYASWALDATKRFVEWVDVSLIVNDNFLHFIYAQLTDPTAQSYSVRASCAAAFAAIVAKRMDAQVKAALMVSLRVVDLLAAIPYNVLALDVSLWTEAELGLQSGAVEIAALVRCIALEALEVLKRVPGDARATDVVDAALPVAVRLLDIASDTAHELEAEGATAQALELVASYVAICKRSRGNQDNNKALESILQVVFEKARFPDSFDPAQADDGRDNEHFIAMRTVLLTIFRNTVIAAPNLAFAALRQLFLAFHAESKRKPSDIELQFSLVENTYEVLPEHRATVELVTVVMLNAPADLNLLVRDARSEKTQGHQLVSASLMYFDLASRVHKIISSNGELLAGALRIFFGDHGLCSLDRYTRSRCAYLLLKFVRPLRFLIAERHTDDMLSAFQPLLAFGDSSFLSHEDECYLYEAAGLVLGIGDQATGTYRVGYINELLKPLIAGMDAAVDSDERGMTSGVQCLSAAGALSKGFTAFDSDQSPMGSPRKSKSILAEVSTSRPRVLPQEVMSSWTVCLEAVLRLRDRHCAVEEVRRRVLFFFHRMVETLGEATIPYLANHLPNMMRMASGAAEVTAIMLLVNQAICKFQAKMEHAMESTFVPIVQRLSELLPSVESDAVSKTALSTQQLAIKAESATQSEELRERIELLKVYLTFLHNLLTNKLGAVLLDPAKATLLEQIALSIVRYGQESWGSSSGALMISKQCYGILSNLISQVLADDSDVSSGAAGFRAFVTRCVGSMCVRSAVLVYAIAGYSFMRYNIGSILRENVALQLCATRYCGASFLSQLVSVDLPSWQCSAVSAELYGKQLMSGAGLDSACSVFCSVVEEIAAKAQRLA